MTQILGAHFAPQERTILDDCCRRGLPLAEMQRAMTKAGYRRPLGGLRGYLRRWRLETAQEST